MTDLAPGKLIDSKNAVCFFLHPHEAHEWAYTSESGGHMIETWDVDADGFRLWNCPGRAAQWVEKNEIKREFGQYGFVVILIQGGKPVPFGVFSTREKAKTWAENELTLYEGDSYYINYVRDVVK